MEENKPAVVENKSMTLPSDTGEGFDCMNAGDLVMEKIAICQPTSKTEIAPGHWYDTSNDQDLGEEISLFVLAKKDVEFEGKDFETGEPTTVERKEILVVGEDISFPKTVSLSATGYWPLSALLTNLYKKYGVEGKPIFSALIKAKTELKIGDKGKYYVPKFEAVRVTTPEELEKISSIYNDVKPIFMSNDISDSDGNPTGAEFKEPEIKVEDVPQEEGDMPPDFLKKDEAPEPEVPLDL